MSRTAEFDIGCEVACSDGVCGVLSRVVVDPVAQAVTHLVVEPRHRRAGGHLVPIKYVVATGKRIELTCTLAQFAQFEDAQETDYLPASGDVIGYGSKDVLTLPLWSLHRGGYGPASMPLMRSSPGVERRDWVPLGEVDVRRGEAVHAADGEIGRVEGLVIEPDDHHVTHILLEEGHLWGQKRVAIPISAVTRVGDTIRLTLKKDEVRDLPPVDVDHPLP
ncbi:MAG TPA: PRC-barrel domain-containing protein [Solirubrobacteraceae bacterium]|nr:PRC-barrel domain-containing protein [Solirubrobacteraceae bacterium]